MAPAPPKMLLTQQSIRSAALELKYHHSVHAVELLAKDEDIRRLRFDVHVLEDDNDELREQLQGEEDRSAAFEKLVTSHVAAAEATEGRLQDLETDLRTREWELQAVIAEKNALEFTSADAAAVLTEKLALTRELSILKPELEHLRVQVASTETLTAEKLALQSQVVELQCDVENARREAKRALAKRRNTGVEIAQEEQVEDLKRQLTKERRARERAEQAAEQASGDNSIDDVRKQLSKERKARQRAEEQLDAARDATQLEDVRKDLLHEKKFKLKLEETIETLRADLEREKKAAARAAKRAGDQAQADDATAELRDELANEKRERAKAERASQQAADEFEAQKVTLEDKLNQFRTKLKSTKEKLKETEAELATAREAAAAAASKRNAVSDSAPAATKGSKKRNIAQMDPDATTLGTPGDRPAGKRKRKTATTGVGDKSTFSITPFLNKTVSVAMDEVEEEDSGENSDASEPEDSPAANRRKALAPQPTDAPQQPQPRKPKARPTLAMVTEDSMEDVHSQGQENANKRNGTTTTMKVKTKDVDGPTAGTTAAPTNGKPSSKRMRKSIADIPVLAAEPEVKQKKKRKLGGLGKTLFDEDEEDGGAEASAHTAGGASKGLFGGKGFGVLGASKKSATLLGGKMKVGSSLLTATDGSGFQFSPLKKARRNLDDTLRG